MLPQIALALRICDAARAGRPPAQDDAVAMARALLAASQDEERQPSDYFLGLTGAWRTQLRLARRAAACAALVSPEGESVQSIAMRVHDQIKADQRRGLDSPFVGPDDKLPAVRTLRRWVAKR